MIITRFASAYLYSMNAITYVLYRVSGPRRAQVQTSLTSIGNPVA